MTCRSTIELFDLEIQTSIGTYGPNDVVPEAHLLDLTLEIDPSLVLIKTDGMPHVFDYDPLIRTIDALARDRHYDTQERLMTRIATACAQYEDIRFIDIRLRKTPVLTSGHLGVRLTLEAEDLKRMRTAR